MDHTSDTPDDTPPRLGLVRVESVTPPHSPCSEDAALGGADVEQGGDGAFNQGGGGAFSLQLEGVGSIAMPDRASSFDSESEGSPLSDQSGLLAASPGASSSPRTPGFAPSPRTAAGEQDFTPRVYDDDVDGFEWAIVFGGDRKKVKFLMEQLESQAEEERADSAIGCLELKLRATGKLRVRRETSGDGTRLALLVGAKDERTLLKHAQQIGFKKEVINTNAHKLATSWLSMDFIVPTNDAVEAGWGSNHQGKVGYKMGYHALSLGPHYENLAHFACKSWLTATGQREHEFFDSGERLRLVLDIVGKEEWANEKHSFGLYNRSTGTYHMHLDLVDAESRGEGKLVTYMVANERVARGVRRPGGKCKVYLEEMLALNNPKELAWLKSNWADWKLMFSAKTMLTQPLEQVSRYYGTKVGLYFAWLQFYTRFLIPPSILGVVIWTLQLAGGYESPNGLGRVMIFHSIILSLWATLFIATWTRYETGLRHSWGTDGYQASESQLPSFKGKKDTAWSPVPDKPREQMKPLWDYARYSMTVVCVGMILAAVSSTSAFALFIKALGSQQSLDCHACNHDATNATTSTDFCHNIGFHSTAHSHALSLRSVVAVSAKNASLSNGSSAGELTTGASYCERLLSTEDCTPGLLSTPKQWTYMGSLINVGFVMLFVEVYDLSAPAINKFENYRTKTDYNDALIIKGFLFSAVNFYFLLFYLAFATMGAFPFTASTTDRMYASTIFGYHWAGSVTNNCRFVGYEVPGHAGQFVVTPDCLAELNIQLILVFLLKSVFNQIVELCKPVIKKKWSELGLLQRYLLKCQFARRRRAKERAARRGSLTSEDGPGSLQGNELVQSIASQSAKHKPRAKSINSRMSAMRASISDMALRANIGKLKAGALGLDEPWDVQCRKMGISWEQDMHKEPFPGTNDEYKEICIQFGFMTIFSVAMPVAALCAWLNNITEIRGDASKLCTMFRRPPFREAEDIGAWDNVLLAVSFMAVIINSLLMGFVSTVLTQDFFLNGYITAAQYCEESQGIIARYQNPLYYRFVLVMEHCVFAFKFMLVMFVPTQSRAVRRAAEELQWFVQSNGLETSHTY